MRFQGRFEHTMDEKGRVAVPAPFRKRLQDHDSEAAVVVTVGDRCLSAYPKAAWEQILEKIGRLNQLDKNVVMFKRVFVGCAQECSLDKAGRILVPGDLKRHAEIARDCVLLGQMDKFEIWSAEKWSETFATVAEDIGSITAALADSGVTLTL